MKNILAPVGSFVKTHETKIWSTALVATAAVAVLQTKRLEAVTDFIKEKDLLTEFHTYLSIDA